MMIRITEREQIKDVAVRWRHVYESWYPSRDHKDKLEIQRKLDLLDVDKGTANDVATIIGNDSWVHPYECTECHKKSYDVVMLGEEDDYESRTIFICPDCLRKALLFAEKKS